MRRGGKTRRGDDARRDAAGTAGDDRGETDAAAPATTRAATRAARPAATRGATRPGCADDPPARRRAPHAARPADRRGAPTGRAGSGSRSSPAPRAGSGRRRCSGSCVDGWHVVAVDRAEDDPRLPYALGTAEQLAELASERVQPIAADVTDPEAMQAAVDMALKRWGGLDAIVAAAGVIAGGVPAWELDAEQERAVLEVNLGGVITAARVGIPALLRRPEPREGRFIAVASAAASKGLPMLAAYCASKAGVTGFIRALAVELGGTGHHRQRRQPRLHAHRHPRRVRAALRRRPPTPSPPSSRSAACSSPTRSPR